MATLTTEWQQVASSEKWFDSDEYLRFYIDAKVGSPNVAAGTIPIYTRLRSAVKYNGWSSYDFSFALTYAPTKTRATENNGDWYYATETVTESATPTDIKYDKEGYKSVTLTAVCTGSNGTGAGNQTFSVTVDLPKMSTWYIDVGGILDGTSTGNTSGYGTFNVDINGVRDATGVTDFYKQYIPGTTYSISGMSAVTGKSYAGVQGSLSGTTGQAHTYVNLKFNTNSYTITYNLGGGTNGSGNPSSALYGSTVTLANPTRTGYTFTGWTCSGGTLSGNTLTMGASNVTLTANWSINTYTNTIGHYAAGFVNGEGDAGGRKQFIFLGNTSFIAQYGSTITYDSSKFTTIPNGYTWSAMGGNSFDSSWVGYPLGQQFSQPAKNTSMQFDYYPIPYTITYNLDGGTNNNNANPTSYNVLYGVTFAEPTKEGYTFTGWTIDEVSVTGINPGLNATFSGKDDMFAQLATRTTGNKTVVAHWEKNQVDVNIPVKVEGSWKSGVPYVKQSGEWKKGTKVYVKKEGVWVLSK